jgi:amino acid permease
LISQKPGSNHRVSSEENIVDPSFQPDSDHALTVFGAVLTIVSTIVGGGIVGLPYAFLELGLWISLGSMVLVAIQTMNSIWIYLKAKDLIPAKPESLYELGYILLGRKSIFFISACLTLNSFGLCMVYLIIFSDTMKSICKDVWDVTDEDTGFQYLLAIK